MDPYFILLANETRYQSKAHKNGGQKPVWNETIALKDLKFLNTTINMSFKNKNQYQKDST